MKGLSSFRELDSNFDSRVTPLEDVYNILDSFKVNIDRDEREKVD